MAKALKRIGYGLGWCGLWLLRILARIIIALVMVLVTTIVGLLLPFIGTQKAAGYLREFAFVLTDKAL